MKLAEGNLTATLLLHTTLHRHRCFSGAGGLKKHALRPGPVALGRGSG